MKQRFAFFVSVVLIALATAFLALILTFLISITDALPLVISLLALVVSILSSFKNELFPFQLSIFADGLHLVKTPAISPNINAQSIVVLLPVTFFNRGYSEGIVQTLRLRVIADATKFSHDFLPSYEIDMTEFIQQKVGLNASNTLGAFSGFLIEPKLGIRKNIVFTPLVEKDKSNTLVWQPDTYRFELYVQIHGSKQPKKYFGFEKKILKEDFTFLKRSNSIFFYPEWKEN